MRVIIEMEAVMKRVLLYARVSTSQTDTIAKLLLSENNELISRPKWSPPNCPI